MLSLVSLVLFVLIAAVFRPFPIFRLLGTFPLATFIWLIGFAKPTAGGQWFFPIFPILLISLVGAIDWKFIADLLHFNRTGEIR